MNTRLEIVQLGSTVGTNVMRRKFLDDQRYARTMREALREHVSRKRYADKHYAKPLRKNTTRKHYAKTLRRNVTQEHYAKPFREDMTRIPRKHYAEA